MPFCKICNNDSYKCYIIDLTITSDFDNKNEQIFERNSTLFV
jgi:hypothetical protein